MSDRRTARPRRTSPGLAGRLPRSERASYFACHHASLVEIRPLREFAEHHATEVEEDLAPLVVLLWEGFGMLYGGHEMADA